MLFYTYDSDVYTYDEQTKMKVKKGMSSKDGETQPLVSIPIPVRKTKKPIYHIYLPIQLSKLEDILLTD